MKKIGTNEHSVEMPILRILKHTLISAFSLYIKMEPFVFSHEC